MCIYIHIHIRNHYAHHRYIYIYDMYKCIYTHTQIDSSSNLLPKDFISSAVSTGLEEAEAAKASLSWLG